MVDAWKRRDKSVFAGHTVGVADTGDFDSYTAIWIRGEQD